MAGADPAQYPTVQRIVGLQVHVPRVHPLVYQRRHRRIVFHAHNQPHAVAEPSQVLVVGQQVVVQVGMVPVVARVEPHLALGVREIQPQVRA